MELNSTLKVFNENTVPDQAGIVEGQVFKILVGNDEHPTEKIFAGLASFEPGTHEHLHWHPIEVFYYVISGTGVMHDIEGNKHDLAAGSTVYAPAGIAGAHSWEVIEPLQLIAVRATNEPEKMIQFTVDPESKASSIDFDFLMRQGADHFKSFY